MNFSDLIPILIMIAFVVIPSLKKIKPKMRDESVSEEARLLKAFKEVALEIAEAQEDQANRENRSNDVWTEETFWKTVESPEDLAAREILERQKVEATRKIPEVRTTDGRARGYQVNQPRHEAVTGGKRVYQAKAARIPETQETEVPEAGASNAFEHDAVVPHTPVAHPGPLPIHARGLQKAVIWSEILGKPVALREP